MTKIQTSYAVCAVQRSGSSLLCEALKNTGLAGVPEEYFLVDPAGESLERGAWAREHGAVTREDYLALVREKGTTANGVFGTKLMWNYFPEVIEALRALPEVRAPDPHEVLAGLFPNLHYLWIVREDKVAQAVSWTIAAQTGIYAAWQAQEQAPLQAPEYDFERIDALHDYAVECERGWAAYFEARGLRPMVVVYEELVREYEATALRALDYLGIPVPEGFATPGERTLTRQATGLNAAWARRYREEKRRRV